MGNNESIRNGIGSVNITIQEGTKHLNQVSAVVNDSTNPTDQDIGFQCQGETKAMAKSDDDSDQDIVEGCYDPHSSIEELINNASSHR